MDVKSQRLLIFGHQNLIRPSLSPSKPLYQMSRNFPAATKSCCQSWGIKKNNMVRYVYFVGSYLNHYSICWNFFVKEVNETIPRLILPSFSSFFKWWTRFTLAAWCRCSGVSWERKATQVSVSFFCDPASKQISLYGIRPRSKSIV